MPHFIRAGIHSDLKMLIAVAWKRRQSESDEERNELQEILHDSP
jgi:hypothetical protein